MTTRERNYYKKPHTASFLQTFHTARTEAQRVTDRNQPQVAEEQAAVSFVTNRPARPDDTYLAQIGGFSVRFGTGLLTEPQAKFVTAIANTREGVTEQMRASLGARLEQGFAKAAASAFISTYKDLPRKEMQTAPIQSRTVADRESYATHTAPASEVPDGRYAVEHEGTLKFFKVKNGRKPGFVFLDVQASDDWHPIRNLRKIAEILALISADELTAARRYGMELGKCSRCGRTLTDETSRAYGIGPDCRNK